MLRLVRLPPRPARGEPVSTVGELREGWTYFRSTTWLWVVVLGFGVLNGIHIGAWFTLGPAQAKATIGEQGWGYVLSAESLGLILTAVIMLRRPLRAPLRSGMLGISLVALPMFVLGWSPHLAVLLVCTFIAGAGTEVFSMGWNLAMQENVPERMLSRAYLRRAGIGHRDARRRTSFGPLERAYGDRRVLMLSGLAYLTVCLLVLTSKSDGECGAVLPRRRRPPTSSRHDRPAPRPAWPTTSLHAAVQPLLLRGPRAGERQLPDAAPPAPAPRPRTGPTIRSATESRW